MVSISVDGANAYFHPSNHIRAQVWHSFSEQSRAAGIAHARRLIERKLQESLDNLENESEYAGFPRYDYAVYEQACCLLQNSAIMPDGNMAGPKFAMPDPEHPDKRELVGAALAICPEATDWIIATPDYEISRG